MDNFRKNDPAMLEDLEKIVPQATVNEGTYKGYKLMKGEVIDVLGGEARWHAMTY